MFADKVLLGTRSVHLWLSEIGFLFKKNRVKLRVRVPWSVPNT